MQHYSKRNPPWIKLYAEILDDEDFEFLSDTAKLIYFCLLPFASRKDNKVKNDTTWLSKKLPIEAGVTSQNLQELVDAGFIKIFDDDSNTLAICTHLAKPETEGERETKTEKETNKKTKHLEFVLLTTEQHGKLLEQFGESGTAEKIQKLNDYIGSTGKKYKSHYHTILSWSRKDAPTANTTPPRR